MYWLPTVITVDTHLNRLIMGSRIGTDDGLAKRTNTLSEALVSGAGSLPKQCKCARAKLAVRVSSFNWFVMNQISKVATSTAIAGDSGNYQ